MAIVIQQKSTKIPIEIGDITLSFDTSDENIKRFYKGVNEYEKKLHEMQVDFESKEETEETGIEALDSFKDLLKESFDFMLGEGSFDKVYNLSPEVAICAIYFFKIGEGIREELEKKRNDKEFKKYLK